MVLDGEKKIKVRSRNPWSANMFSPWSDKREVNIDPGGYFNTATAQAGLFNINVNPLAGSCVENSFNQDVVVVNQPATYQGFSYGCLGSPSYTYDFNDETTVEAAKYFLKNPYKPPMIIKIKGQNDAK